MTATAVMEPGLVELIGSNLTERILVFSCTSAKVTTFALVDWVARSSRCPLLSKLSFRDRLRYRVVGSVPSTVACAWEHLIVAARVEKLCCHHHLLLLRSVRIWRLPLVDQVEQVGLVRRSILVAHSTRRADSVVAHAGGGSSKST